MRVAIATEGDFVAQHFGKCPGFTIVDIEDGKIVSKNFVENPNYKAHQPGAVPMFLKTQNVDCIIAGGMGPKAIMMLESFGIKVLVGVTGKVEEVIDAFIKSTLHTGESLCKHDQHHCRH
uniref:Dinitrogenase iron-molybdenum cofactor n=1 Tax=Thermodesulfobacterium geofontis TaxID=1295609 RepID=A0A7V6CEB1_9BACT